MLGNTERSRNTAGIPNYDFIDCLYPWINTCAQCMRLQLIEICIKGFTTVTYIRVSDRVPYNKTN
jgi:hypothetical protein